MDVRTVVFEALGAATMCWEHIDKAGVFQSEKCKAIGDELMGKLDPYINELATRDINPRLGLASTMELLDELQARADIARTLGEDWPSYRKVLSDVEIQEVQERIRGT